MGGLSPIPWTSIYQYSMLHDLGEDFVEIILQTDSIIVGHVNKKDSGSEDGDRKKSNPA